MGRVGICLLVFPSMKRWSAIIIFTKIAPCYTLIAFRAFQGQDLVTGCTLYENLVQINSYYNIPDEKNNAIMNV
jgi:hypothetical protein